MEEFESGSKSARCAHLCPARDCDPHYRPLDHLTWHGVRHGHDKLGARLMARITRRHNRATMLWQITSNACHSTTQDVLVILKRRHRSKLLNCEIFLCFAVRRIISIIQAQAYFLSPGIGQLEYFLVNIKLTTFIKGLLAQINAFIIKYGKINCTLCCTIEA